MPAIKVKRSLLWDAWQLNEDSYAEVLSVINEKAIFISSTENSITFKNNGDNQENKTLNFGDWLFMPNVPVSVFSIAPNTKFREMFDEVPS